MFERLVQKDPILVWSLDTIAEHDTNDSDALTLTIVMLLQIRSLSLLRYISLSKTTHLYPIMNIIGVTLEKNASDTDLHSLTGNRNAANMYSRPYFTSYQSDFRQIALKNVNWGSSTGLIQSNYFTGK